MNTSSKINKWTVENSFDKKTGSINPPQWPHEVLVKLFSSRSYSKLTHDIIPLNESIRVVEIGCMGANNLRFFSEKGCVVSGVEVTEDLVNLSKTKCKHYGIENVSIFCGNNQSIPLDDSSMDILVSVNTLHYEQGAENINNALENFSRVLRSGGVAFIETVAPEHFIYKKATKLDDFCFRSNYDDFRKNDLFGFFESSLQFKSTLQNHFSEVEVITVSEFYEDISLQFYIGLAKK